MRVPQIDNFDFAALRTNVARPDMIKRETPSGKDEDIDNNEETDRMAKEETGKVLANTRIRKRAIRVFLPVVVGVALIIERRVVTAASGNVVLGCTPSIPVIRKREGKSDDRTRASCREEKPRATAVKRWDPPLASHVSRVASSLQFFRNARHVTRDSCSKCHHEIHSR